MTLDLDDPALFVGEYRVIKVVIDPASGLTMSDLDFDIPAGPTAGSRKSPGTGPPVASERREKVRSTYPSPATCSEVQPSAVVLSSTGMWRPYFRA